MAKNPDWLKVNQLAISKRSRGFETRTTDPLPRTNPALGQGGTSNSGPPDYMSGALLNHSATLPPLIHSLQNGLWHSQTGFHDDGRN